MKLYHVDVFMPQVLRQLAKAAFFRVLVWTRHAQRELVNDRYGVIPKEKIPASLNGEEWELIELETEVIGKVYHPPTGIDETGFSETRERITKYVFRRPVDKWRSLVIVLRPRDGELPAADVITCWTNLNTDKHATLDPKKYATA